MRRFFAVLAASFLLAAAVFGTVIAKSPHTVDPLSVSPPLNPDFSWTCFQIGTGITCQGTFQNGPASDLSGIVCDGQELTVAYEGFERMTRWHDAQGRATKTVVHLDYPGDRFTLSADGTGPAVTVAGHWNRHYTYGIPGDRSTRVLTERGAIYVVRGTDGRVILRDVGQVEFAPGADFDEITRGPGQHDLYGDGFVRFEAALCDELT